MELGARSIQPKSRPVRPGKVGRDPFNQNSNRSDREKWSTSKGGPVFSKLFQLDRTDPLSFGPKFPEILVEWIAPLGFRITVVMRVPDSLSCIPDSKTQDSRFRNPQDITGGHAKPFPSAQLHFERWLVVNQPFRRDRSLIFA